MNSNKSVIKNGRRSKKAEEKIVKSAYASVTESDGVNYREIADTMTEIGFRMNHSSARNYVLRVMRKFATAIIKQWDLDVEESRIESIIKTPQFQQGICDILQTIEENRKFGA